MLGSVGWEREADRLHSDISPQGWGSASTIQGFFAVIAMLSSVSRRSTSCPLNQSGGIQSTIGSPAWFIWLCDVASIIMQQGISLGWPDIVAASTQCRCSIFLSTTMRKKRVALPAQVALLASVVSFDFLTLIDWEHSGMISLLIRSRDQGQLLVLGIYRRRGTFSVSKVTTFTRNLEDTESSQTSKQCFKDIFCNNFVSEGM